MADTSGSGSRQAAGRDNALLTPLPEQEYALIAEHLEVSRYQVRQPLYQANAVIEFVYFPLDGLASLVTEVGDDFQVEVGATGREGMVGIPIFLGAETSPHAAFCQVPGHFARMPAATLIEVLARTPVLADRLRMFSNLLMGQLGQNAACNRAHNAEQRCARWLLLTADRVGRDEYELTHRFLAQMLGVRRATVSDTARELADEGLIRYQRGIVTLLDRDGLTQRSCSCYEQLRAQVKQLEN